ncbi:MAG TPA: CBS domain-containing protein [Steroidobacteraceae bacterium]|nr:CBS domain-containing protein [Steroidobacteraceae bacterium]
MNPPFLLALEPSALPALSPRSRPHQPQLRPGDPAVRAMSDFLDDPPRTVAEDTGLEEVVDHMFRLGVRAFLVVHERSVIGLITAEDADAARRARQRGGGTARELRAADVMTPACDVPAIDWQTLQDSHIRDLIEIFEGSGVRYLVVLQTETASWSTVRGLIHRQRLDRQLKRD